MKGDWIFAASVVWFATILGVLVYILFFVKMNWRNNGVASLLRVPDLAIEGRFI